MLFPVVIFIFPPGESFGDRNDLLWGKRAATCQWLCQRNTWVAFFVYLFPPHTHTQSQSLFRSSVAISCILLNTCSFPGDANLQISSLAEELARKTEDASRQQEEITHLLSQIVDLQKKAKLVRKSRSLSQITLNAKNTLNAVGFTPVVLFCLPCCQYALENEELTQHLGAAKDAQRQLTAEVGQSRAWSPWQQHCVFCIASCCQMRQICSMTVIYIPAIRFVFFVRFYDFKNDYFIIRMLIIK